MKGLTSSLVVVITLFALGVAFGVISPMTAQASSFERMFQIWFENEEASATLSNSYWSSLLSKGQYLGNYYSISHPSQPNYIASIAGATLGCNTDGSCSLSSSNLVDLLEAKGISWKAYVEDLPGKCSLTSAKGHYARKHVPFISFTDITSNPSRCAKIVDASQLQIDIDNNQLPQWSYYVPNQLNDGHDTDLDYSGQYLTKFLSNKLNDSNFIQNTLVVITFDEAESSARLNKVFTLLIGPDVVLPGSSDSTTRYDHYSLLATAEANWNLGNLGRNDAAATPFVFVPPLSQSPSASPPPSSNPSKATCRRMRLYNKPCRTHSATRSPSNSPSRRMCRRLRLYNKPCKSRSASPI